MAASSAGVPWTQPPSCPFARPAPPAPLGTATPRPGQRPSGVPNVRGVGGWGERTAPGPSCRELSSPEAHASSSRPLYFPLPETGAVPARGRRHQPAPAPHAAQPRGGHAEFLMLACGAGRGTRGETRVAAALRRHAGVQPQRGEDLQSQLRQVSARGEALRGPPSWQGSRPLLGPGCCVSLVLAGPWLGEARRLVTVPRGSWSVVVDEDTALPAPEARRRATGLDELRWNFCHVP